MNLTVINRKQDQGLKLMQLDQQYWKSKEVYPWTFDKTQSEEINNSAHSILLKDLRHGSQIRPQLSAASPTNRPQPKVIITKVIMKLMLWPAAGCEAKVVAELSSRP